MNASAKTFLRLNQHRIDVRTPKTHSPILGAAIPSDQTVRGPKRTYVVVVRAAYWQLACCAAPSKPNHSKRCAGQTNQSKVGCNSAGQASRRGNIWDNICLQQPPKKLDQVLNRELRRNDSRLARCHNRLFRQRCTGNYLGRQRLQPRTRSREKQCTTWVFRAIPL